MVKSEEKIVCSRYLSIVTLFNCFGRNNKLKFKVSVSRNVPFRYNIRALTGTDIGKAEKGT